MHRRFRTCLLAAIFVIVCVACVWRLTHVQRKIAHTPSHVAETKRVPDSATKSAKSSIAKAQIGPIQLLSQPGLLNSQAAAVNSQSASNSPRSRFAHRLSNTKESVSQLARRDKAILLENALFDTESALPTIPAQLQAEGDPGTYIVQAKGPVTDSFRSVLQRAGATIISYIPNNAYLVRASASAVQSLAAVAHVVVPYEPYYKLKPSLLDLVMTQKPLPDDSALNVSLFADARQETLDEFKKLGVEVVSEERSPFGPVVRVRPPSDSLATLARMQGVQAIEMARPRVHVNDLSRVRVGVSTNALDNANYLGLTGNGTIVNVNDTGVDANHPDLLGRVIGDFPASLVDSNGHGTHVAGIIASSGLQSSTVTNAEGSIMPGTNTQFRGMAPSAKIFSIATDTLFGSGTDSYLQETAAKTNAFISNNSWGYFNDTEYDLAAASYDAAVRDALPERTGSQPIVYVFAAGNSGGGNDQGTGGSADTIGSPGTAKNVITVGAIEQYRNITNKTTLIRGSTTNVSQPWMAMTDSSNAVASFSSRGNVGIGVEGDFGRFKPDVVAPGTFVVSTTWKQDWDQIAYYNPTNYHFDFITDQVVQTNTLEPYAVFVPENTVQLIIRVFADVDLPIYVRQATVPTTNNYDVLRTNIVSIPPDIGALSPRDTFWNYAIGNPTSSEVSFTIETELITTNDLGNYLEVLSNMNNSLGPFYRYESGTSMSAADISGMVALMQEYFEQRVFMTNSPALMKALLINGARPVADRYDLQVNNSINFEGWGLANLQTSIPTNVIAANNGTSMLFFDQSPTNALATNQKRTYTVTVDPAAVDSPLRVTLVWTDPPGNPVTGIKLVNDLDLIVSNYDSGDVFYGNDILAGSDFNLPWDTNVAPNIDIVNNVENVFLLPPLGGKYDITVVGKRVNVNAVTAQTNNVVQDFALVVSCGDGEVSKPLKLTAANFVTRNVPNVLYLTNQFSSSPDVSGALVLGQRVGGNPTLIGTNTIPVPGSTNGLITLGVTNQWHFYVLTNEQNYTNAAFVTILPPTLSIPRMGVNETDVNNATRIEADIELYVSTDPDLTNLDASVIAAADKSIGRGGTETLIYSNAQPGGVYYVGVKSEDHEAAEYGFLGVFSLFPFGNQDSEGNWLIRGLNVPAIIPDGSPEHPGGAYVLAVSPAPIQLRRVIVTNAITHENAGDLFGVLRHGQQFAVLNNHSFPPITPVPISYTNIYEDNGQKDIAGSRHTDGPGSLRNFVGDYGFGPWILTEVDNAPNHTGRVDTLWIKLEKQHLTDGVNVTVQPNSWFYDSIDIPKEATNLTVCVSGNTLPLELYLRRGDFPTFTDYDKKLTVNPPGACLSITKYDLPPLRPGRYFVGVFNPTSVAQTIRILATVTLDLAAIVPTKFTYFGPTAIPDDAVSTTSLFVSNAQKIVSVDVGVRIDHPRVSDLVLHLVSPTGKRVMLFENRGGNTTSGLGGGVLTTNVFPQTTAGDFNANTNTLLVGQNSGILIIDYQFFDIADDLRVYYDGNRIFDSGLISGPGRFAIEFGPGASSSISIVMNEGGNSNTNTQWNYTAMVVSGSFAYFTFTEDTNYAKLPVKFAPPPFNAANVSASIPISGFELNRADVPAPGIVDGWTVETNQVTVIQDPALAQSGNGLLALASGRISRTLPTVIGRQYGLSYAYRGPGIATWWRGEGNAVDAVSGANGTFNSPAAVAPGLIGQAFTFPGTTRGGINVPDVPALQLTRSLSIEGWVFVTNPPSGPGEIIFRGDVRGGLDPYFLDVEPRGGFPTGCLQFGIEDAFGGYTFIACGTPIGNWAHLAATLEDSSGSMRIYTNGVLAVQTTTAVRPLGPLDPNSQPGVGIGNHSSQPTAPWDYPFRGRVDELSVYQRAISASEVKAIYNLRTAGKFDASAPIPNSLAEARVAISGISTNVIFGSNTNWQTQLATWTANQAGTPIQITGIEPGMLLDSFTLNESGGGLFYLPEESLDDLKGDSAYGEWKLEIWDNIAGATNPPPLLVGWQLRFVFEDDKPAPIVLRHNITETNTIPTNQVAYFVVDVPSWASFATNILISASAPVNLLFNQNIPPTGIGPGDYTLLSGSMGGVGNPILSLTSTPRLVPGARYYLGVRNPNSVPVTVAVQVDFDVTPLTNAIPLSSVMPASLLPRYFSFDVSTNAVGAIFQLLNLSGDVNLVARKGLPFPAPYDLDYGSFNPGTNDENIIVFTNSTPVPLSSGRWYLGVFNAASVPASYTILATEYPYPFANIITLTNRIPYYTTNFAGADTNDLYRFVVSSNSVRAQFEINGPTADMTLVARKGWPPPNLATNDYRSANPGTNDELIIVFDFSKPVRLSPGDWFLTAINVSGGPVAYSIMASEWPLYGTNIIITNSFVISNSFCLTWTSLPGVHYYVQGKPDLVTTNWTIVSPTITAVDYLAGYCVPLPSTNHFFRVHEGIVLDNGTPYPSVAGTIGSIAMSASGIRLQWSAPVGAKFQVQWSPSLSAPVWNNFSNIITSDTGTFSFLDDGSQSGGLGTRRFYRFVRVP
jgi:subtilisin family serine protease/subtilisin-like proprotein convertase family protein